MGHIGQICLFTGCQKSQISQKLLYEFISITARICRSNWINV